MNRDERLLPETGAVQAPKLATRTGSPEDGAEVGVKVEKGEGAQSGEQAGEERQKRGKEAKVEEENERRS